jgi:hypothetical protein
MRAVCVALLLAVWANSCVCDLTPVQCRDPDVGGTTQNKDRKFMVLGSEGAGGAGLGNILIFYPAAFYFAAVTGRDIIIQDHSIIGEFCSIINCGFPFVSQVALAFPDIVNQQSLSAIDDVKAQDFQRYMEGSRPVTANIVRSGGFQSKSDWWVWFNTTVHCVHKITGCDRGDVMCAERHAYQRLIRGPFKSGLSADEEKRIHGVPDNLKHAILTLPHAYAPRLDAAVHLRAQFNHFESQANIDDPNYIQEVSDFLNGTESKQVFDVLEDRIVDIVNSAHAAQLEQQKISEAAGGTTALAAAAVPGRPVYIYVAADNEAVKDFFCARLLRNPALSEGKLAIMKVETKGVMHAKNIDRLKDYTQNEGLLDLVFDWYALSLANTILAWRKGGTSLVSTFVHSAQKVSGTTERTDNNAGRGIGTRGYQLIRTRNGGLRFDLFWVYSFLEDFLIRR